MGAWHAWESLGSVGIFDNTPVPVSWGPGRLDLFAFAKGAVQHVWFQDSWAPLEALYAGQLPAEDLPRPLTPSVTSWGPGRLDLFAWNGSLVNGGDNLHSFLFQYYFDGAWGSRQELGESLTSPGLADVPAPVVVSWGPQRLDVFWPDEHTWYDGKWHTDTPEWGDWPRMSGATAGCSWGEGRIDLFALDDGALMHTYFDVHWSPTSETLTPRNTFVGPIRVVSWGPKRIDVFGLGPDGALWHHYFDGFAWHGPESLGAAGVYASTPEVVSWGAGRLDLFGWGADGLLWHQFFDGTSWLGPETLPEWQQPGALGNNGNLASAPKVVSWGPGRIDVFAIGTDRALWHTGFQSEGSGSWFGFLEDAVDAVIGVGRDLADAVTGALSPLLAPIGYLKQAAFTIPIVGRAAQWVDGGVATVINFVASIPDIVLTLLGFMPNKRMRIAVIIQRDEQGTPLMTESAIAPWLAFAQSVLLDQAHVTVLPAGMFVHTAASSSDASTLDVCCGACLAGKDLTDAGSSFTKLTMNETYDANQWRVVDYGSPIVAFIVRQFSDGKIGCSLGPLNDYVVVKMNADSTTLAHELGHSCSLWHYSDPANLMNPSPTVGLKTARTQLTRWQKALLRSSRHVTFL